MKTLTTAEFWENFGEYIDPTYRWLTKDKDDNYFVHQDKPCPSKTIWLPTKGMLKHIWFAHIDFGNGDWTQCISERPQSEQDWIGKWCKFSDNNVQDSVNIGILDKITNYYNPYLKKNGTFYKYCQPLTESEIQKMLETNRG